MTRRIVFVCTGNICRSPTAEGVLRHKVAALGLPADHFVIASAGTGDWHVGDPPDPRSQAHARRRGVEIGAQRAQQFTRRDFDRFDLVIAMDDSHHDSLRALCPPDQRHKLRRAGDFSSLVPAGGVPDPYYGGEHEFEHVLDLVEAVCEGVLAELNAK